MYKIPSIWCFLAAGIWASVYWFRSDIL